MCATGAVLNSKKKSEPLLEALAHKLFALFAKTIFQQINNQVNTPIVYLIGRGELKKRSICSPISQMPSSFLLCH